MEFKVQNLTHPQYDVQVSNWSKYRHVLEGGREFVDQYLQKYSTKEDEKDYDLRKAMSYNPAHAESALIEVRNSIFRRMIDIERLGGSKTYQQAMRNHPGTRGVDGLGSDINSFISTEILPELLALGKVGVFVDRPRIDDAISAADVRGRMPYIYTYNAEAIKSWYYDDDGRLETVLLEDLIYETDDTFNLPIRECEQYRYMTLTEDGVAVMIFDAQGEMTDELVLQIPRIPLVIMQLNDSLLKNIADYQIALLNIASSDLSTIKNNFPFYVEQFDPIAELTHMRQAELQQTLSETGQTTTQTAHREGEDSASKASSTHSVINGPQQGRRYPKGMEAPQFIHPSSEPLEASMKKQEMMKEEIRQLIHLSLASTKSQHASVESKSFDDRGLEAGLAAIGLELQYGETEIARIWHLYEGETNDVTIKYPSNYSLKSETVRQEEARKLREEITAFTSKTYQQEIAKQVIKVQLGHKVSEDTIQKIFDEIDGSEVVTATPETIIADHSAGLVSDATASRIRGYGEKEYEQARADHADRLKRIAIAQSQAPKEQGVQDIDPDPGRTQKDSKTLSQSEVFSDDGQKKVRGEAQ